MINICIYDEKFCLSKVKEERRGEERNLIGLIALLHESSLSPFRVSSMTF